MNSIIKFSRNIIKANNNLTAIRSISVTPKLSLKEIIETQNGNELTIEGILKESDRTPYLVQRDPLNKEKCPVCALGLDIKHTDVLILSQFLRSDGCMLPRRITGLCRRQQKRLSTLVTMAQKAGLMPNLAPSWSKRDPKKRYGWKKYNKYFDESTIRY